MIASLEETIKKVLGPEALPYVHDFLIDDKSKINDKTLPTQLNLIGNYVTLLLNGNYSLLKNTDGEKLIKEYDEYVFNYKKNRDLTPYIEDNKIILDNRIDGVGFYWVDLEKEFCVESMIRMQDCGRVNYGNTTLELRDHLNESHMIVVYEKDTGNIKQIKGKRNSKPEERYWINLHDLLVNSDYRFNEYTPTYKPENDLLISDLPICLQFNIYSKHPNLKKLKTIV